MLPYTIDIGRFELSVNGEVIRLSRKHFLIFYLLHVAKGNIVRRAKMIDSIYGLDINGGPVSADRAIHVSICIIRKKLKLAGWNDAILLKPHVGYFLNIVREIEGQGHAT